jgi:hypothetical protein
MAACLEGVEEVGEGEHGEGEGVQVSRLDQHLVLQQYQREHLHQKPVNSNF